MKEKLDLNRSIVFFPQNITHVDNMIPIAQELSCFYKVFFIDAMEYYCQSIYSGSFNFERVLVSSSYCTSFYLDGFYKKVKRVREFERNLPSFDDVACVVVANDGALQRVVLNKYRRAKSVLVLDGIISDYSFSFSDVLLHSNDRMVDTLDGIRRKLRKLLAKNLNRLPLNEYLPSEIGSYEFDVAFTLSKYVDDVIELRQSPIKEFCNYGLPRYSSMLLPFSESPNGKKKRLLIITQGYIWHNEYLNDGYQHIEVGNFLSVLNKFFPSSRFEVVIRVHPRDSLADYKRYGVALESSDINLRSSLENSDAVFGFNSTVLLESAWYGRPTFSLLSQGQFWKFKNSFIGKGVITIIKNNLELQRVLCSIFDGLGEVPKSTGRLFNPIYTDTVDRISKKIIQVIND